MCWKSQSDYESWSILGYIVFLPMRESGQLLVRDDSGIVCILLLIPQHIPADNIPERVYGAALPTRDEKNRAKRECAV